MQLQTIFTESSESSADESEVEEPANLDSVETGGNILIKNF